MLGAIIGDIVGSRFEWNNHRSKDFEFLTYKCFPTDDSIMSLAIAQAILVSKKTIVIYRKMRLNVCRTLVEIIPTVDTVEAFMDGFFLMILSRITVMETELQCE